MQDHRLRQSLAAGVVALVGAAVLVVGWWLDVELVREVLPGQESMKANTAVGLLLLGVGLHPRTRDHAVREAAGALLVALGLATIVQYWTGADLGIDQLLATDPSPSGSGPGRPGFSTAVCFVMLGSGTMALPRGADAGRAHVRAGVSQALALAAGLIALMNFMAYVFGSVASPGVAPVTQMALNTAVGLMVAGFAAVDAASVAGPLQALYSTTTAGRMVRLLIPVTALGLLVAGGVVAALGRSQLVEDPQTQLALQATLGVTAVVVVVGLVAHRLDASAREVERQRAELIALNAQLEQRVADRTAALASTVADLERSNAELEQFAYVASHDLQEPLRMVSSFVQRLDDRYGDQLDDRGREYMRLAVDGAVRMSDLVEALLHYSRVGRTELALQPVELDRLVDEVLLTMRARMEDEDATVVVERPLPGLVGDPTLLRQVIQNLLGNAMKFRREGVPAEVRVAGEVDDGTVCLVVEDNGIGIDPQFREDVFRMFRRLHARRTYPGTGIGLSITSRIVERHGGSIVVAAPEAPHGTRIVVRLPVEQETS